jgi:glutathione S-transferase
MLAEAGLEAEFVSARPGSDEAKAVHPLGKLPALVIEDSDARTVLFESAAIVTYIADLATSLGCSTPFIAAPGSVQRAQHDQWVSFALTDRTRRPPVAHLHPGLPAGQAGVRRAR